MTAWFLKGNTKFLSLLKIEKNRDFAKDMGNLMY